MFLNSIDDFCLWGSPKPNGVIGDVEGIVVAYCTKPGRGTRLIPPGTLTAVQFIKTPGYIQVTGLFNQVGLEMQASDSGGELDPHGDDLAGNPLGGLVFSNNLPTATKGNTTFTQVKNWSSFVGSDQFCFKACDNSITNPDYCLNIYDTEGCDFNMPASYQPHVFSSCLGENQAAPGGNAEIPATSSCTTYSSTDLYPVSTSSASTSASTTATSSKTGTGSGATATSSSSSAIVSAPRAGSSGFLMGATVVVAGMFGVVAVL
jgi:hypothetical protein